MKLIVKNLSKCTPRLGIIKESKRLPNVSFETPMVMLYTKGGNVPHLTRETMYLVTTEPQFIQVPLVTTSTFFKPMSEFAGTIADFVGLDEYLTCVTVQDPADITPNGHHLQNNIPIWTRSGKLYVNSDSYMDTIESFKPDMYCILSDGDTNKASSKKRVLKSVDQTLSLFTKCLDRHLSSGKLKESMVIAAVEGGYCLHSRQKCIDGLLKHSENIDGFLIDGLHNNGPEVELLTFDDVKEIVQKIIYQLPGEKLRMISGCWNPLVILQLASLGIDVFDTSYTHIVTERQAALTFNYNPITDSEPQREYEINFSSMKYSEDFSPLVEGCQCLTCTKYTRAYIQHLINVQELLGPILLNMHNIHHYLEFFKQIRQAIKDGLLENLQQSLKTQFEEYQRKLNGKSIV